METAAEDFFAPTGSPAPAPVEMCIRDRMKQYLLIDIGGTFIKYSLADEIALNLAVADVRMEARCV